MYYHINIINRSTQDIHNLSMIFWMQNSVSSSRILFQNLFQNCQSFQHDLWALLTKLFTAKRITTGNVGRSCSGYTMSNAPCHFWIRFLNLKIIITVFGAVVNILIDSSIFLNKFAIQWFENCLFTGCNVKSGNVKERREASGHPTGQTASPNP